MLEHTFLCICVKMFFKHSKLLLHWWTAVTTEISVWRRSSGNAVARTSVMLSYFKEQHAGVYANKALVHRSLDYISIDMKGSSTSSRILVVSHKHITWPLHKVMSHHHPWSSLNMIHLKATTPCPGLSSCVIFLSTYILYIYIHPHSTSYCALYHQLADWCLL